MQSLAEALGWPTEIKRLRHNWLNRLPNLLLGATSITVDKKKSSPLAPPWPDVVIAASRRAAPVALWIRKQSGGRTRLVHLLHVQAPLRWFDLVVTMPQYRLPEAENVLHVTGVLNRIDPAMIEQASAAWLPRLEHLPRPWTAVLIGGNSSSYLLDRDTATELARKAAAQVRERGGSLLVTTSPRTPPEAAEALAAAIDVPSYIYVWKPDDAANNPYKGFLALADDFVVTVDSASLLVEASATGRDVAVYEWPRRGGSNDGPRGLEKLVGPALFARLLWWGIVKPRRDFDAYHAEMKKRGLAHSLGKPPATERRPLDDLERTVERIHALLDFRPGNGHPS